MIDVIGSTVSHYRIVEKLGEGGMGVVYRAHDEKLDRPVALKFLKPGALDEEGRGRRLVQEARAAASLDHPNICTVYEVGEDAGRVFIAMALVDGPSLGDRLRSGPLRVEESVRIVCQVARGLAFAHQRGIVHRDVKPGNVMVTREGHVRLMDFGLAKTGGADQTTTLLVGTPAYMSPEQIRGDVVDHRTDIWSLGVLTYHMLAGRAPFRGSNPATVIHSVLHDEPEPLSLVNPEVSMRLSRVVDRAMAKRPEERFQGADELLAELELPEWGADTGSITGPVGRSAQRPSIAVLAFDDMSPQRDQEYFCDGIADEIINDLTRIENLHVAARTSSFAFKGKQEDVREIGRKLAVRNVLEGSVRKAGDRVRVTAQLINVADGYHLWSERYEGTLEDVFAIQEEIARSIVERLRGELSDREQRALAAGQTRDVEAFDFYLRGRQYFYLTKRRNMEFAISMFERATRKDPEFALAYCGLADCYSYLFTYFDPDRENLRRADEASRRALDLRSDLAEAHASRGLALSLSGDSDEADREFERALELNPNLFEAYYFWGRTNMVRGHHEEAVKLFMKAGRANPDDYQALTMAGFILRTLGRVEESRTAYSKAFENIRKHLELVPDDPRAVYLGAEALVELGERDRAMEWIDRALRLAPEDPYTLYGAACFFSRQGFVERGAQFFVQSVKAGFSYREWIENDRDLDPIRDHPAYLETMRSLEIGS